MKSLSDPLVWRAALRIIQYGMSCKRGHLMGASWVRPGSVSLMVYGRRLSEGEAKPVIYL